MDQLWPNYVQAARDAKLDLDQLQAEIVIVGWSKAQGRIVGSAYAKSVVEQPTRVAELVGGIAAPGQPLRDLPDSFHTDAILAAGRRQAEYVNAEEGRHVAGGRLIAAFLQRGQALVRALGTI